MKTLSRDAIQRMNEGSTAGGGGSFDPSVLGGMASQSFVENGYVSKLFLNALFTVNGTETVETSSNDGSTWTLVSTTAIVLAPNETPSQVEVEDETTHVITRTTRVITDVQVKAGLWSNSFVSALGLNSAGGGGGTTLNEPLASINTASLGSPSQAGQVLTWNGSAWVYDIPSGGASALSGLTDVALSSPSNGQALVYNATSGKWENQTIGGGGGGGGTLTAIGLIMPTGFTVNPSTLMSDGDFTVGFDTGYGLPLTADVAKGVTAYGWGNHANAGYLMESAFNNYLFWGQSINNGVVQGSIDAGTNGGAISGFDHIELNTEGSLAGYGGYIDFHYNGALSDYTARIVEATPGVVRIYNKLQIGDAVIEWDSTNQCLKINGGVYATGFVSALGLSSN